MERAALRLASVGCLLAGGHAPYPTLAGGYVFDSVMDQIQDLVPDRRRPTIIVRTDEDVTDYRTGVISGRQCRLLMEISVLTGITDAQGRIIPDWPTTDTGLELMLDLMEWQVWLALLGWSEWSQWYRNTAKFGSMLRYSSTPRYSGPERGSVRLAVRTLEFVQRLASECIPKPVNELSLPVPDVLPPRIIQVFEYLIAHSQGGFLKAVQSMYDSLKTYGPAPVPRLPAFQRVWATFPDFETEANWKMEQSAYLAPGPVTTDPAIVDEPHAT